ncbi:hypothetical protein ACEPAG_4589 [Sanghuangporus baumii]
MDARFEEVWVAFSGKKTYSGDIKPYAFSAFLTLETDKPTCPSSHTKPAVPPPLFPDVKGLWNSGIIPGINPGPSGSLAVPRPFGSPTVPGSFGSLAIPRAFGSSAFLGPFGQH